MPICRPPINNQQATHAHVWLEIAEPGVRAVLYLSRHTKEYVKGEWTRDSTCEEYNEKQCKQESKGPRNWDLSFSFWRSILCLVFHVLLCLGEQDNRKKFAPSVILLWSLPILSWIVIDHLFISLAKNKNWHIFGTSPVFTAVLSFIITALLTVKIIVHNECKRSQVTFKVHSISWTLMEYKPLTFYKDFHCFTMKWRPPNRLGHLLLLLCIFPIWQACWKSLMVKVFLGGSQCSLYPWASTTCPLVFYGFQATRS